MTRIKTLLFAIVILVFGMAVTSMASTYIAQPGPTATYHGDGDINWTGLFNSLEQYELGSHHELYTHSLDTVGGTMFADVGSARDVFVGQGLSLPFWEAPSATGQYGNERISAVVAALAGFLRDDRIGSGTAIHHSFNTLGQTSNIVPIPGSLWFLFSGLGMLGIARRGWWRK